MTDTVRVPLQEVDSSLFSHVGYDAKRQILAVRFRTAEIWHYGSVPHDLVVEFLEAPSLGAYYGLNIKGKFPGEKMTGECPKCGDTGWIGDTCLDCGCAPYAAPIRHALVTDHPASTSRRLQPAMCGHYFKPGEMARRSDQVTCPECLAAVAAYDAMEIE